MPLPLSDNQLVAVFGYMWHVSLRLDTVLTATLPRGGRSAVSFLTACSEILGIRGGSGAARQRNVLPFVIHICIGVVVKLGSWGVQRDKAKGCAVARKIRKGFGSPQLQPQKISHDSFWTFTIKLL